MSWLQWTDHADCSISAAASKPSKVLWRFCGVWGESHVINITGPSVVHCGPIGVKLRETQRDVDCGDQKVDHFIFMWTQWIIYMGHSCF